MTRAIPGLHSLARMHGVQPSYYNVEAERVGASDETLLRLLRALGVPIDTAADVNPARREATLRAVEPGVEPVLVAWDGRLPSVAVRTPPSFHAPLLALLLEDGTEQTQGMSRPVSSYTTVIAGATFAIHEYVCGQPLPYGYHTLRWQTSTAAGESLLISAPSRCYAGRDRPEWGLFAPLYALRSEHDWGAGSYSDLRHLAGMVRQRGGDLTGTLPILPCFYGTGDEPSPYLPISRLLWSEFFINVEDFDLVSDCPEALELMQSRGFANERNRLSGEPLVDYPSVLKLKQQILEALALFISRERPSLAHEIDEFLLTHPQVRDYAAFRAAADTMGRRWREWPDKTHDRDSRRLVADPAVCRYHEFAQWLAHQQIEGIADSVDAAGLYLDLPIGVHPDGYDAWRYRAQHLSNVSCGAPPDIVFTTGQDWLAPPMHPEAVRRNGYEYWRLCLRHHMRCSDVLRVDHVMGLHRMYCIPHGLTAAEGAYIRYRHDEMYAVLSLESHRSGTTIVGEDLGTVPHAVRRSMTRHGLNRMFVLYYEMPGMADGRSLRVQANSLACISTHDMPPFAAIWRSIDVYEQARLGILARKRVRTALSERQQLKQQLLAWLFRRAPVKPSHGEDSILRSVLSWLGASRARYVIANIDDFWMETRQPNVPGAGTAYPNWTQRLALTLEQIARDSHTSEMTGILERERARRRKARKGAGQ